MLIRLMTVGGSTGIVIYHRGLPFGVITLEVADDRVQSIYFQRNPDKLHSVPAIH